MKKQINKFIFILTGIVFIMSGCAENSMQVSPQPTSVKKEQIKINIKQDMDKFEKQLIEVSKKAEYKYNEYIELLKTMKKKKEIENNRIPRNLGRRFTFCFDGYALLLIKKVVTDSGYDFNLGNLLIQDSPIIHRCYKNTMAIDILRDISTGYGYDIIIDEKNMEATVRYTE